MKHENPLATCHVSNDFLAAITRSLARRRTMENHAGTNREIRFLSKISLVDEYRSVLVFNASRSPKFSSRARANWCFRADCVDSRNMAGANFTSCEIESFGLSDLRRFRRGMTDIKTVITWYQHNSRALILKVSRIAVLALGPFTSLILVRPQSSVKLCSYLREEISRCLADAASQRAILR